ncbi:MAG: UDP-N-acetyl-D-glucosamine dehydrogenase [Planctomycetes bacterium SM23_32]|nr:MAG: UDP-N-acetyl-D-glucosamine dehydrogenase [Planctomycetes bacterium SM23_32]
MTEEASRFVEKVRSGDATLAIVGLGYVGLPLALVCSRKLKRVVGIDVDARRVDAIGRGKSYIDDVPDAQLGEAVRAGKFSATADYGTLRECDVVIICVPTPLRKTGDPDLSFIVQSVDAIARHLAPGKLVVLESTSYPGTTRELVCPRLEEDGLVAGRDFWLAFSPERVDPGPAYGDYKIEDIPKVVGGITPSCTRVAAAFYGRIMKTVVEVSTSTVAEMVKLLENTYRSVNIAMVNELALMCHELGIDVWEVVDAAKTKPYGFEAFYPGPGLGGHCIPVDPFYLAWKARLHGFEPRFIDLAGRINAEMPRHVVQLAMDLLNQQGKPLRDARVHVLGVAYKRDVSDTRESPALLIMEILGSKGALVSYTDDHVPAVTLADGTKMASVPLERSDLPWKDLVIIVTDHSDVPWGRVVKEARLILDTRNVLKDYDEEHIHKI